MVQTRTGGSVHILKGVQNTAEYEVTKTTEGKIETTTCCEYAILIKLVIMLLTIPTADIEASIGDTFTVETNLLNLKSRTEVHLSVDGNWVDGKPYLCRPLTDKDGIQSKYEYLGYRSLDSASKSILKAFTFDKMPTTSE
jgi:hypothetical protein